MNIEREWKRDPPEFGRRFTLDDLVADFKRRRADPESPLHKNRDDIVDYCAEAPTYADAVRRAVNSVRPNGKVHNHQSRVPALARKRLGRFLIGDEVAVHGMENFDDLLALIQGYGIVGIGPVTEYDVAVRVGAWVKLSPTNLHLHAGCLEGMRGLAVAGLLPQQSSLAWLRSGQVLEPEQLPRALRRMTPDEAEDFLCVYRAVLHRGLVAR